MLFSNLGKIVRKNYSSLSAQSGLNAPYAGVLVGLIFGVLPIELGILLAHLTPVWTGLIASLAPVLSVLTGFSINAIVLLTRHTEVDSYDDESRVVSQTQDFTLYAVFIGLVLIAFLLFGFIVARSSLLRPYPAIEVVSALIYSVLVHYFLVLGVVVHRMYSLVNGGALSSN